MIKKWDRKVHIPVPNIHDIIWVRACFHKYSRGCIGVVSKNVKVYRDVSYGSAPRKMDRDSMRLRTIALP